MLRGNVQGGPGNRIRNRLSPTQLLEIKSKTRCLNCKQYGHWRRECPNKQKQTTILTDSIVQELDGRPDAPKIALWVIAQDEDAYFAYIAFSEPSTSQYLSTATEAYSSLSDLVGEPTDYLVCTNQQAESDAGSLFNTLYSTPAEEADF